MKNKSKIVVFMAVITIFILTSCKKYDPLGISLIIKDDISDQTEYVSLYSDEKSKEIDRFVSDDFEAYSGNLNTFSTYIFDSKVSNEINEIILEDSNGKIVKNNEEIIGIYKAAEQLEHDIWQFQIFKVMDRYFTLVKINTNWQSPCDFYEYNKTDKTLNLLSRFDGIDIIGISLEK